MSGVGQRVLQGRGHTAAAARWRAPLSASAARRQAKWRSGPTRDHRTNCRAPPPVCRRQRPVRGSPLARSTSPTRRRRCTPPTTTTPRQSAATSSSCHRSATWAPAASRQQVRLRPSRVGCLGGRTLSADAPDSTVALPASAAAAVKKLGLAKGLVVTDSVRRGRDALQAGMHAAVAMQCCGLVWECTAGMSWFKRGSDLNKERWPCRCRAGNPSQL